MTAPRRIAVVGAGLAGLTAARALADAGAGVTVFEKSRGLGGRLATRRTRDGLDYDHGAPAAPRDPEAFAAYLDRAEAAGAAARAADGGAVGVPSMSGLVAPLATSLDLRFGVEVAVIAPAGAGWTVDGAAFDAVVCAAPAPQTARLCAASARVSEAARAAAMDPCYTLMCAFPGPAALPDAPPPPFASLHCVSAAPGRAATPARWVAHAGLDWTRANLEREREDVAPELLSALAPALGRDPAEAIHVAAHRWRFARVSRPVGAPFVADGTLLAAGDWLLGPDAGHAHASGLAAAAALTA
jgi:predicted NAD/FAD-dependent oxidoreductase